MRTTRDEAAEAFAHRLQQAARKRGVTSDRSRSSIDVAAVAEKIGASYEMARRYVQGMAMPKPDVIRSLARWLRVSADWLAFGEGLMEDSPGDLDLVLLEQCIQAVVDAQVTAGVNLDTGRLSHLVAALYREAREGRAPSPASVAATLKALAR